MVYHINCPTRDRIVIHANQGVPYKLSYHGQESFTLTKVYHMNCPTMDKIVIHAKQGVPEYYKLPNHEQGKSFTLTKVYQ